MQFYYFLDSKITTESLCSNNDGLLFSGNFKVCYIEVSCFLIELIWFFFIKTLSAHDFTYLEGF